MIPIFVDSFESVNDCQIVFSQVLFSNLLFKDECNLLEGYHLMKNPILFN